MVSQLENRRAVSVCHNWIKPRGNSSSQVRLKWAMLKKDVQSMRGGGSNGNRGSGRVKVRSGKRKTPLDMAPSGVNRGAKITFCTFKIWWRRGELNPRPQVLRHKVYMLISLFNLADDYPSSQENHQRFRKVLAHPHRTYFSAILCR